METVWFSCINWQFLPPMFSAVCIPDVEVTNSVQFLKVFDMPRFYRNRNRPQ